MAVLASVDLPAQPTTGDVHVLPLGGNGWSAPHSATVVRVALASDVSGGVSQIKIVLDPRYVSLIAWMNTTIAAGASAVANRQGVVESATDLVVNGKACDYGAITGVENCSKLWMPPGCMCTNTVLGSGYPYIVSESPNVNGQTHTLRARILNFDKQAAQRTPLPMLLASLVRG